MQDRDDQNTLREDNEVDGVGKPTHQRATHLGFDGGELPWVFGDPAE